MPRHTHNSQQHTDYGRFAGVAAGATLGFIAGDVPGAIAGAEAANDLLSPVEGNSPK